MVEHLLGNMWKIESDEVVRGVTTGGTAEIFGPAIVRVDHTELGLQIQSLGGQMVYTENITDFESVVHRIAPSE